MKEQVAIAYTPLDLKLSRVRAREKKVVQEVFLFWPKFFWGPILPIFFAKLCRIFGSETRGDSGTTTELGLPIRQNSMKNTIAGKGD